MASVERHPLDDLLPAEVAHGQTAGAVQADQVATDGAFGLRYFEGCVTLSEPADRAQRLKHDLFVLLGEFRLLSSD